MDDRVTPPRAAEADVSPRDEMSEAEIDEYWTVDRKRNARPVEERRVKRGGPQPATEEQVARDRRILDIGPTTARVEHPSAPPFAAVGKLFFQWKGRDWVGSAWIVDTPVRGIVTAAHNVYDERSWSSKLRFELQYDAGHYVRAWEGSHSVALKGWTIDEQFAFDMAVVVPKSPIDTSAPALPYVVDEVARSYLALGYPTPPITGFPFDGEHMWMCAGDTIAREDSLVSACNNLTRGSSGGPWCARRKDVWYANGIQSHRFPNPDVAYSPALTSGTFVPLLRHAGLLPG